MDDNRCFLAANPIKSLENALLAVKYGARNALHSHILSFFWYSIRERNVPGIFFELLGVYEENWKSCQTAEEQNLWDEHVELLGVYEENWKACQSDEGQNLRDAYFEPLSVYEEIGKIVKMMNQKGAWRKLARFTK